jgi:hypothetical protein
VISISFELVSSHSSLTGNTRKADTSLIENTRKVKSLPVSVLEVGLSQAGLGTWPQPVTMNTYQEI